MNLTKMGKKWEWQNSFYLFFGFIPIVNSLILLHMDALVRKKIWQIIAWGTFAVNIAVYFTVDFLLWNMAWVDPNIRETASVVGTYALPIINLLVWFYLLSQRSAFLRQLARLGSDALSRGVKWRFKRVCFLIFGGVPLVNSALLLLMNAPVGKKKWKLFAWITFALNLFLSIFTLSLQFFDIGRYARARFIFPAEEDRFLFFMVTCRVFVFVIINLLFWFYLLSQRYTYLRALEAVGDNLETRAVASKGSMWAFKNSAIMFLGGIPIVNSVLLFHLNSVMNKKKLLIVAWGTIALNIVSGFLLWGPDSIGEIGFLQQSVLDVNVIGLCCVLVVNLLCWFFIISQRTAFLNKLAKKENQDSFEEKINSSAASPAVPAVTAESTGDMRKTDIPAPIKPTAETRKPDVPVPVRPVRPVVQAPAAPIELNAADEDELSRLPDLTIVDVRRALEFRSANGGFRSVDEFFDVIHARPHVIAHLQDLVFVEPPRKPDAAPSAAGGTATFRQIDF